MVSGFVFFLMFYLQLACQTYQVPGKEVYEYFFLALLKFKTV